MRITYSALLTLLLANAVPSLVAAQDLSPNWPMPPYDQHLDHVVPIATVARVGGRLALANPRTVQDAQAEPFVLGAATLDLTNPSRATVTLTVTNTTDRAIPWNDLMFEEVRICGVSGQTHGYPTVGGRGGHPSEGEVPPGAKISVLIPVAPNCAKEWDTEGILVFVGKPAPRLSTPPSDPAWDDVWRLNKVVYDQVFEKLRTQAPQQ